MSVSPVPDNFATLSVHIVVRNSLEAMAFYEKAFGAVRAAHMAGPGGQGTMHASMTIGNSTLMMVDENPQWQLQAPESLGGRHVTLHLYVDDADAAFQKAVDAGCTVSMPIQDTFWGDRYGKVIDPHGYEWSIATRKEILSEEEMAKRAEAAFAQMGE